MIKSFLTEDEFERAKLYLRPPILPPTGRVEDLWIFDSANFSRWLGFRLEERMRQIPGFLDADPIALGSWSRGEISLRSDIDMLFCGPEAKVKVVMEMAMKQGLKIRARTPENINDWTVGVIEFDQIGLLQARPLTAGAAMRLHEQQKMLLDNRHWRRKVWRAIMSERKARSLRFDDMSQLLEPQIKFGPGGLRDIEQALVLLKLFPQRRDEVAHPLAVLNYVRTYLNHIRHKIQIEGFQDHLVADAQFAIHQWFGFKDNPSFMRDVHASLARSLFYSDWILEQSKSSSLAKSRVRAKSNAISAMRSRPGYGRSSAAVKVESNKDIWRLLKDKPSMDHLKQVRESVDDVFARSPSLHERVNYIYKIINRRAPLSTLTAAFRSRWLDHLLPELRPLIGYVQFDQYHRFTADAHLYQILKRLREVWTKPKQLGVLAKVAKNLTASDWEVLEWTALFHDLGKGSGADHESKSRAIASRYLKKTTGKGVPGLAARNEILWLVQNHLLFTHYAFKRNFQDTAVMAELHRHGLTPRRADLLVIFSALDIHATNPDAYNSWKAELLLALWRRARSFSEVFLARGTSARKTVAKGLLEEKKPDGIASSVDPLLIEILGAKQIARDLELMEKGAGKSDASQWQVHNFSSQKGSWVRWSTPKNQPGVLSLTLFQLWKLGYSVEHAFIGSMNGRVYDWFKLSEQLDAQQFYRKLELAPKVMQKPSLRFQEIDVIETNSEQITLGFYGKDRKGLLYLAAQSLAELSANVLSAKVSTWGRRVEDYFVIENSFTDLEAFLKALRSKLLPEQQSPEAKAKSGAP